MLTMRGREIKGDGISGGFPRRIPSQMHIKLLALVPRGCKSEMLGLDDRVFKCESVI